MSLDSTTKRCAKCGETKPLEAFSKLSKSKDGRYSYCRACLSINAAERRAVKGDEIRAHAKARYAQNSEQMRAYQAAYRDRNPEKTAKHRQQSAAWYRTNQRRAYERARALIKAHPERAAIYDRRHYDRHVQESRAGVDRYRRANLIRYREAAARRRARERAARTETLDYRAIWDRDNGICHICHQPVDRADLHYDHVIPLSKGGPHTYENIKVSHSTCNLRKSAKLFP